MRRYLDLLTAIVGTRMRREHRLPADHADPKQIGDDGQRPLHVRTRNRIVVPVKTRIRRFARGNRHRFVGRDRVIRQSKEAFSFQGKRLADSQRQIAASNRGLSWSILWSLVQIFQLYNDTLAAFRSGERRLHAVVLAIDAR